MATWEEYLSNQEANDGVKFTWNMWPHSRIDAQRLVVPLACFFTPLKVFLFLIFDLALDFSLIF